MKILVNTDYYHETFHDMPQGLEVCFAEDKPIYSVRDMDEKIRDVEILVIASLFPVSNQLIDKAPKLKLICNLGAGFNNVDIHYARQKGITVCNTPDSVTQSTAEIAMSLMLGLMRRTAETNHRIRTDQEAWMGKSSASWAWGKSAGVWPKWHNLSGCKWFTTTRAPKSPAINGSACKNCCKKPTS